MKINILIVLFITSNLTFASDLSSTHTAKFTPTWLNTFNGNTNFTPMIIGSGLNYIRDDEGDDSLAPSLSWMMKYEIGKYYSLKTNLETIFSRNQSEESAYISSSTDFYFGVKTSREFEIALKTGVHFSNTGEHSVSYGIEIEHNSKFLKRLNISSLYFGVELIPNLEVGKKRVFSGARFNL